MKKAANGELAVKTHTASEQRPQVALMLLCAADLPLSVVGDVVTWPYAAAYCFINQPIPPAPAVITDPTLNPPAQTANPAPPPVRPMTVPTPPIPPAGLTHYLGL